VNLAIFFERRVRVTSRGDAWRERRLTTIAACCGAYGGAGVARSARNGSDRILQGQGRRGGLLLGEGGSHRRRVTWTVEEMRKLRRQVRYKERLGVTRGHWMDVWVPLGRPLSIFQIR
jgi:hypothetical protein